MDKFYIATLWDNPSKRYVALKASCKEVLQHEINKALEWVRQLTGHIGFYKGIIADETTFPVLEEGEVYFVLWYSPTYSRCKGAPCYCKEKTEEGLRKQMDRLQENKAEGILIIAGKEMKSTYKPYSQIIIQELNDEEILLVR